MSRPEDEDEEAEAEAEADGDGEAAAAAEDIHGVNTPLLPYSKMIPYPASESISEESKT